MLISPPGGRLLNLDDDRCFFPELFQLIELALAGSEDVHHDARIVHQHPAGFGGAFAAARFDVDGLECMFFDTVGDGLELPFAGGRADDKVVYIWRKLA
jgi:hypothetical protein